MNASIHIHSPAKVLVGVGVSKRYFKRAVDRNRIKRLIREAYRLQKNNLWDVFKDESEQLFCFIQYTQATMPTFKLIHNKIEIVLKKLVQIMHEKDLHTN